MKKRNIALFLGICIVFVSISWAWIEENRTMDIVGKGIALTTSPGLVIMLNDEATNYISLNSYIADNSENFVLAEASSADGENLFIRVAPEDPADTNVYLRPAASQDRNTKYFYFTLAVRLDESILDDDVESLDVWIDSNVSHIQLSQGGGTCASAADVIRISLEISKISDTDNTIEEVGTYVFANHAENDNTTSPRTNAVVRIDTATGRMIVGTHNGDEYTRNPTINTFNDFGIGTTPLFNVARDELVNIVVKIWLEGGDPDCVDDVDSNHVISGSALDIFLRLTSIEPDEE